MGRNYIETGRSTSSEQSLNKKLTGDVVRVLETMDANKLGANATFSQIKHAFPYITDRDIDRTTGKSKKKGNNTAAIPSGIIIELAVGALNRSHTGKPTYEKMLKSALKTGEKEFIAKKDKAINKTHNENHQKQIQSKTRGKKDGIVPKNNIIWHS